MYKYFTEDELRCKCGCGQSKMDSFFMEDLDDLREALGEPIIITSGYRCPDHNDKVSSTGRSGPHTTGKAVDIKGGSKKKYDIFKNLNIDIIKRIGISKTFIHIDSLTKEEGFPEEVIWTY